MKKTLISLLLILSIAVLPGCKSPDENSVSGDQTGQQNGSSYMDPSLPYSAGPTYGTQEIKGPTAPPIETTTGTPEGLAEMRRTQQTVSKTYTDAEGEHTFDLTVNINEDEIKGLMIRPSFKGETREHYRKLADQAAFKKLDGLDVQPVAEIPEISQAFISALNEAIEIYKKKNGQ